MFRIGDVIKSYREEQRISQEDLSFGICSVSNLSRIENNIQTPSRATYEALMQRLGLQPSVYPSFESPKELTAFRLMYEINDLIVGDDMERAEAAVLLLEKEARLEPVYIRFILHVKAIVKHHKDGNAAEYNGSMKRVADITIRNFEPKNILRHLLTKDDLMMLNSLALSYLGVDNLDTAIEILSGVKNYIEHKVVDFTMVAAMHIIVLFNLSALLRQQGNYKECIELCESGIKVCRKSKKLNAFSGLLFNKGFSLLKLGYRDEAQECIQESYYIDRAMGNDESMCATKIYAEEHGMDL